LALMLGASAGDAAREDLAALGCEALQEPDILVVDVRDLLLPELSELLLPEEELLPELFLLGPVPIPGIHVRCLPPIAPAGAELIRARRFPRALPSTPSRRRRAAAPGCPFRFARGGTSEF